MKKITKLYILGIYVILMQITALWGANSHSFGETEFFVLQALIVLVAIFVLRGFYKLYKKRRAQREFNRGVKIISQRLNKAMLRTMYGDLSSRWISKVDGNNRLIHIYEQRRIKN